MKQKMLLLDVLNDIGHRRYLENTGQNGFCMCFNVKTKKLYKFHTHGQ